MMRKTLRMGMAMGVIVRVVDVEAQPGECVIAVVEEGAGHLGRQSRRPLRGEHFLAQVRKGVADGGDEHVAGHAADGVEMDVQHRGLASR